MGHPQDTEDRLLREFDEHITDTCPGFGLLAETFNHRLQSPVEPCERCGCRVFLLLPAGRSKPVWLQLGDLIGVDTLFPKVKTRRHHCGDGDSWSVEAALFVETAMASWGVTPGGA